MSILKKCKYNDDRLNTYTFHSIMVYMNNFNRKITRLKIGPVMQKVLLLIEGGVILGLTRRPDKYFKIVKKISKEWQKINERALHAAIRKLYQSKLVDYKEKSDGTISMILTDNGKKRAIQYNLDSMEIKRPKQWDRLWRLVIFDIPEEERKGRNALSTKLKELKFYPLQKSVFIHPYECKNEIDFIAELFNLRPYVRLFTIKETDIELDLRNRFNLR